MSITSYAQNFEDVMLWRALGHVSKGFYIDIGAQHPVTDSVSKAFYEKGWRGIHVEATPAYAALLRQDRPDELVIEAAVNDVHGVIRFFEIPATGISTGDPDVARSHQARGFDVHEIVVPCVTLEDIFQQVGNQDIHWLKVDVESMEEQVLRSWGQSPARPWVVVVESTVPLTQIDNHLPWEGSLLERGYTHAYFDGLNRYYLAADQQHLTSAFVSGPNVFDGFTLNGDASAPFCAAINDRHRLAQQALQDQLNAKDEQTRQLQGELQAKEQETRQLHEQYANQAAQQQALVSKWQADRQALQGQNKEAEHANAIKQLALQELVNQRDQESQSQAQSHLQNLVQREQAFAAQLQALQSELNVAQQAALERTIALEIEARDREHALRSKAADDLLQANHQAQAMVDALSQIQQHREKELQAEKTQSLQRLEQAREEFQKQIQALEIETREREHALRSKAADDLLQANQQAKARLDALSQSHQRREDALQAEKTQSLQRLEQAREEFQKQIQALEIETREREHALRSNAADDLLQANQQAQARLDALSQSHQHREDALQAEKTHLLQRLEESHAESQKQLLARVTREQDFSEKLQELEAQHQEQARTWTAEKTSLFLQIERLQLDLISHKAQAAAQAQQHAHLLEVQAVAHQQALADCAAIEEQLKAEMLNERHNSQQLCKGLAEVRSALAATHDSWTWRATGPLRAIGALFSTQSELQKSQLLDSSIPALPVASPTLSSSLPIFVEPLPPMLASSPPTDSYALAHSLDDLLGRQGHDFVHCAYLALMGRAPDPDGLAYYMGRLQQGYSGLKVLTQLRLSPEGKNHPNSLRGLDDAIARYRRAHHPFLGWVFRWVSTTEDDRPSARNLRRISHQIGLLGQDSQRRLQHMEVTLAQVQHMLGQQFNRSVTGAALLDAATPTIVQDALAKLPVRARQIYFRLKAAANKTSARGN